MCWRGKGWSMFVVSTNVSIASNSLSCNSAAQILVFNSVHVNYFGHVDCWRSSHGFLLQPKIDFSVMHDGLNAWMKKQDCSSILFSYLYDEVHLDCGFDSRCKCSTP